mmetsp:Transcript_95827/g.189955  ORF Transcript_95827/g.189955 Transcript_95827/m.189955 type:complete len:264 (-) Transcript_95827:844-1635(-)
MDRRVGKQRKSERVLGSLELTAGPCWNFRFGRRKAGRTCEYSRGPRTMVYCSSSNCNSGPLSTQWPAGEAWCRMPSKMGAKASDGTDSKEVPVSTAALHVPSLQTSSNLPLTRTPRIGMIQWPSSGLWTPLQETSSKVWPDVQPPNANSLTSASELARNTPKVLGLVLPKPCMWLPITCRKLKCSFCDKASMPRPTMPSKLKSRKGSSERLVAATNRIFTQPGSRPVVCFSIIAAVLFKASVSLLFFMQTISSTATPAISPVP